MISHRSNGSLDPLRILPSAIQTMLKLAKTNPQLGVAHRSAENALLYAYLWQAFSPSPADLGVAGEGLANRPVIVINDKDHGFRSHSPDDILRWLSKSAKSTSIIWNMSSPLADGRLWTEFAKEPENLRHTVLIVDEDQLRHAGVDLRREGSSERTLQEFWEQLYTRDLKRRSNKDSPLAQLTACKAVVVCYDGGVLYYSRDGEHDCDMDEALRMYSLAPKSRNAWPALRPEESGVMFGRDLIVSASIAVAVALESLNESKPDFLRGVDRGCRLAVYLHRIHLDAGYAPLSLNQAMYSELRPEPFGWLFRFWFNAHAAAGHAPPPLSTGRGPSAPDPDQQIAQKGVIQSPFAAVADTQLEKLKSDHAENLTKALKFVRANCKLTRLCSYLCRNDRESYETMKLAFERFKEFSRIDEFHVPTKLSGSSPAADSSKPVSTFATIDPAAARIVTHGVSDAIDALSNLTTEPEEMGNPIWVPAVSSSIPKPEYKWLTPLIRSDIDNFSDIAMLVRDYMHDENRKRPLSLAVFGAPGSGKNTTIEALIGATDSSLGKDPKTFNLSQFSDERDLATAFHQVQDLVLTRKGLPPVVFFDEFDCSFEKEDWGWLKFFLAPMQDGEYRSGGETYHIGRAIFVFSGGISRRYADFERNMTDADPIAKSKFEKAKGPDFVSRLRGHLDIPSINTATPTGTPDAATKVRRALILRAILERTLPQIIEPIRKEACIDPRIIKAMLGVPKFRHEVRSMQAIIEMSHVPKNGRVFTVAELPSENQLSMHVEIVSAFNDLLHSPQ